MSTKVPNWWMLWGVDARQQIINKLQDGASLEDMPSYWRYKPHSERVAVIKQLHDQGSLTNAQLNSLFSTPADKEAFYRQAAINRKAVLNAGKGQLYLVGDKSKTRILPPVYHRLRDVWLRSNRQGQEIELMNTGHVRNTIALLRESHSNLHGAIDLSLGRVYTALRNQPGLQAMVVDLQERIAELGVEDMYPVFHALATEYAGRSDANPADFGIREQPDEIVDTELDFQMGMDFGLDRW